MGEAMTDVKRLVDQATALPWIRPWADLRVRAPGDGDLFGREVTNADLDGISKAQQNLDLAVYAVNHLPDYEAVAHILAAFMEMPSYHGEGCYIHTPDLTTCDCGVQQGRIAAKAALGRLRATPSSEKGPS